MINEQLYRKVKNVFPTVEVANEDIPTAVEPTVGITIKNWRIKEGGTGETYRVPCPFCGDVKHHLYINHISFSQIVLNGCVLGKAGVVAKCFRRNCLSRFDNQEALTAMLWNAADNRQDIPVVLDNTSYMPKYDVSADASQEGIRAWYPDYKPIETCDDKRILSYLEERGVSIDLARQFSIGYGSATSIRTGKPYNGGAPFIMLPIIEQDGLKGVQLRCLPEYQTDDFPKYLFHPACKRNLMLYNRKQASQYKMTVLVEGAFDAIKVGPMAMAMFGHTPSRIQISHIELDHSEGGVIWLPDMDVKTSATGKVELDPPAIARKQCAKWYENQTFPWGQYVVELPKKDAGDMTTQDIWLTIISQIKNSVVIDYVQEFIIPKLI